jgi:hypothetical protein
MQIALTGQAIAAHSGELSGGFIQVLCGHGGGPSVPPAWPDGDSRSGCCTPGCPMVGGVAVLPGPIDPPRPVGTVAAKAGTGLRSAVRLARPECVPQQSRAPPALACTSHAG